ncbi:MAG: hypothetical protein NVS3B20_16990 [Polyangiales bacterium]
MGLGPEFHATVPLDSKNVWTVGFGGNFMHYSIPIAQWTKVDQCAIGDVCATRSAVSGPTTYKLTDERTDGHWVYNVSVMPSVSLGAHGEFGRVLGLLGFHGGLKNDGFTDSTASKGAVEGTLPIPIVGAGYGFSLEHFHLSGLAYLPITSSNSPVNYGLGGMITAGVDLDLWGK